MLFSEDILVQDGKGEAPLFESGMPTGATPRMPNFMVEDWGGYAAWTKSARFDLAQLRAYAERVYANTDAYLARLTHADLDKVDEFAQKSAAHLISRGLIAHADNLRARFLRRRDCKVCRVTRSRAERRGKRPVGMT